MCHLETEIMSFDCIFMNCIDLACICKKYILSINTSFDINV